MTDNAWNETLKKASMEGQERNDVITVEKPIPDWAEKWLWDYISSKEIAATTKTLLLSKVRVAMRALADHYGDLDPHTITEGMIRSLEDILPHYNPRSLYGLRTWAGRMIALYTGIDPWANRRRFLTSRRVISEEAEARYFAKMDEAGFGYDKAFKELILIERGLKILIENLDGFDIENFGKDEIKTISRFMLGTSKVQVRNYEFALSRFVWAMNGYDPLRGTKILPNKQVTPHLLNRIFLTGFEEEFSDFIQWNVERGIKQNTISSYLYKILSVWDALDSIMFEGWKLTDVTPADLVRVRMSVCSMKESTLHIALETLGMFLEHFGNYAYRRAKMLWNDDSEFMRRTWITHEDWLMLMEKATP